MAMSNRNPYIRQNKRLKREAVVVPWRDQWEWESVRQGLLSSSSPSPRTDDALQRVEVWKSKASHDGLPHAIESTAAVAQVQRRDQEREHFADHPVSMTELRLSYSSAVVRCVNGFADSMQQQRAVAASVAALCGQIGIPSWLVDVRHEASHNALPSIEVLRLASSTLMQFMQSEYWSVAASSQENKTVAESPSDDGCNETKGGEGDPIKTAIKSDEAHAVHYLKEYKAAASLSSNKSPQKFAAAAKAANSTSTATKSISKESSKKKRVFDIFDKDSDDSSDDDGDDDYDFGGNNTVGNIWGKSIGTSNNRFAALQSTKVSKRKQAEEEKKIRQEWKANKHKRPPAWAKNFVKHVPMLIGYPTALGFLIWGGIGGAPDGRGVLVPGSPATFPESDAGVKKVRERYGFLLQMLCCAWPGFAHTLLVHAVSAIIGIEDAVPQEDAEMDAGSARKLFFLVSWVRYFLSQEFVLSVVERMNLRFGLRDNTKKSSVHVQLASLELLAPLNYPLNSLCGRCSEPTGRYCEARQMIAQMFGSILGESRVSNFGVMELSLTYPEKNDSVRLANEKNSTVDQSNEPLSSPDDDSKQVPPENDAIVLMPLDDMETFLIDDDDTGNEGGKVIESSASSNELSQAIRITPGSIWMRCSTWESCSIGTLPGYPA